LLGGFEQATYSLIRIHKETTRKPLCGYGFVQNLAQPSLSCDKRIKMKKEVTQKNMSLQEPKVIFKF